MGAVADPVHSTQRRVVERTLAQVVFQDDAGTRDASGFAQELRHVRGVVEHINEEANIERLIRKRELRAIERAARHLATRPRNHFHALDGDTRPALREQAGDGAISTTNIEDGVCVRWNKWGQGIGKHARAASKDQGPVTAGYPGKRPGRWRGSHWIGGVCNLFHISRGIIHFARKRRVWETAMRHFPAKTLAHAMREGIEAQWRNSLRVWQERELIHAKRRIFTLSRCNEEVRRFTQRLRKMEDARTGNLPSNAQLDKFEANYIAWPEPPPKVICGKSVSGETGLSGMPSSESSICPCRWR